MLYTIHVCNAVSTIIFRFTVNLNSRSIPFCLIQSKHENYEVYFRVNFFFKKPRAKVVTPQRWYLAFVFGRSDNGATKQKYERLVPERGVLTEDRARGHWCERKAPNRN